MIKDFVQKRITVVSVHEKHCDELINKKKKKEALIKSARRSASFGKILHVISWLGTFGLHYMSSAYSFIE